MNKSFPYEDEAFDLVIQLEQGKLSPSDIVDWADKKLGSNEYDDEIENLSLSGDSSLGELKGRLTNLISDYPEKYLRHQVRHHAMTTARAIIQDKDNLNTVDDQADFILRCRKLRGLVMELGLERKFSVFWRVTDDAEGLPLNNECLRAQWHKNALKKKDEKCDSIIELYRSDVLETCHKLIDEIEQS